MDLVISQNCSNEDPRSMWDDSFSSEDVNFEFMDCEEEESTSMDDSDLDFGDEESDLW